MKDLIIFIVLKALTTLVFCINEVLSQTCGACNANTKFACTSRNTVQICDADGPTGLTVKCPNNLVCVSALENPCANPVQTDNDCQEKCSGVCPEVAQPGPGINFICLGPKQFRICNINSNTDGICKDGFVCTATEMCAPVSENNFPVCTEEIQISTVAPPTTAAPLSVDEICKDKLNNSKHPLSPPDPFCRKFVYIYLYSFIY